MGAEPDGTTTETKVPLTFPWTTKHRNAERRLAITSMALLLNLLNLLLCLHLFQRSVTSEGRLAGIVFAFLGGTALSFGIAWGLAHDYLDGLQHLLIAGGSVVLFWLAALVLLIRRRDQVRLWPSVVIVSLVLIVPALIGLLIANMRFKIGG